MTAVWKNHRIIRTSQLQMYVSKKQNKTPLLPDWSLDFSNCFPGGEGVCGQTSSIVVLESSCHIAEATAVDFWDCNHLSQQVKPSRESKWYLWSVNTTTGSCKPGVSMATTSRTWRSWRLLLPTTRKSAAVTDGTASPVQSRMLCPPPNRPL